MFWKSLITRVHLWSGLILGVQVLLWMLSGAVMSWYPLALVRGETNAFVSEPAPLDAQTYASPGGIIAQADGVTAIELRRFLGKPAYVTKGRGAAGIYDAASGEKLTPLSEDYARRIAKQDFLGDADIARASLMSFPPQEYRGDTPVWRIDFADKMHTRLYISPTTGVVSARRNDIWRIYDFFWMLHIMDYDERDNFNNWFLRIASGAGLLFALSGVALVVLRLIRGRYGNDIALVSGRHRHRFAADAEKKPDNAENTSA